MTEGLTNAIKNARVIAEKSMTTNRIIIFPDEAIARRYAIRKAGKGITLESSLPYDAIAREARKRGLEVNDFIEKYEAEFLYNDFGGMHIRFVSKKK